MIDLLVNLLILCLVLGLIWWALTSIPLPAPFGVVVRVVFAILAIVLLLGAVDVVPTLHLWHYRGR